MSRPKGSKNRQSGVIDMPSNEPKERVLLLANIIAERIANDFLGDQRLLKIILESKSEPSS